MGCLLKTLQCLSVPYWSEYSDDPDGLYSEWSWRIDMLREYGHRTSTRRVPRAPPIWVVGVVCCAIVRGGNTGRDTTTRFKNDTNFAGSGQFRVAGQVRVAGPVRVVSCQAVTGSCRGFVSFSCRFRVTSRVRPVQDGMARTVRGQQHRQGSNCGRGSVALTSTTGPDGDLLGVHEGELA
ncbi:hypothetical protein TIFTF001_007746 [Ficus carica]|uniref:Uncharacterized protein n=1 Tax=Ficus carica TaxID=3494 RepID=A0AA87ZQV4_FICCA|nr:hypothetical protein TIFTF001_007746 [Ficus carica]